MTRRLVTTSFGQLHCRLLGSGPPLIVLPAANGPRAIGAIVDGLARRFTVLLFDLPGYLGSDALPMTEPTVADYARAIAAAADALGLGRAGVFGSHAGAAVAVQLAADRPDLAAALLLHEIAFFSAAQREEMLARHLPEYRPDWHGAYLVGFWHRWREQSLFRPWYRNGQANRVAAAGDDIAAIHEMFLVQAAAGPGYRRCYEAVMRHDLVSALSRLAVAPTVVAPARFWLDQAAAVPSLARELVEPDAAPTRYAELLARDIPGCSLREPARLGAAAAGRHLIGVGGSHLAVRTFGRAGDPALLVVPPIPGPAEPATEFAAHLQNRFVVVVEPAGCGDSDGIAEPSVAAWVDDVSAMLASEELSPAAVVGVGTGAIVATELTGRRGIGRAVLVNPPLADDVLRREFGFNYAPALDPAWDGSHLVRLWHALRNEQLFWPWYRQDAAHTRRIVPDLAPERLDRRAIGVLKHIATYAAAYRAIWDYPLRDRLGRRARIIRVADELFAELVEPGLAARDVDRQPGAIAAAVEAALGG
jgi:pimeloyl-ACP methyl ester carboxylesterase